ncbi:MAG: hypothetical protein ACYC6A_07350 [Armatimonadota bacterium]
MRHHFRALLLLAGLLCTLPAAVFAAQYDHTPVPADIDGEKITSALAEMKDGLFFLRNISIGDYVEVEFDAHLVPNGSYARLDCAWEKLITTDGKNIIRPPTRQEIENNRWRVNPRIYITEREAKPAFAQGKVTVRVPCAFARLEFAANEVGVTKEAAPMAVTLKGCSDFTAILQIERTAGEEPIVILRDVAGQRLKLYSTGKTTIQQKPLLSYGMHGTIAKVEIWYPTQFVSETLDVTATTMPTVMRVEAPVINTPRYAPATALPEGTAIDQATLEAQTSVTVARHTGAMGFNAPVIAVKLPPAANSHFVRVDFSQAKLYAADGAAITGRKAFQEYDAAACTQGMRFEGVKDFARAAGSVTIRYPGRLSTVTLTPAQSQAGALTVEFHGAILAFAGLPDVDYPAIAADEFPCILVYDADGRRLKRIPYSGSEVRNTVPWKKFAFWGTPAEVRVVVPDNWLTLTLPFEMAPAP